MTTFGDELRREREVRGIELREVAEATKVSLRFLEALERNEFEELPGGLFTRGFIRAYAAHIGADPDKLVNAYLFQLSHEEGEDEGTYRPTGEPPAEEAASGGAPAAGRRGWLWAGAIAILAVPAALLVIPSSLWSPPSAEGDRLPTPGPAAAAAPERRIDVHAQAQTRVRARCGAVIRVDRVLAAGERATFTCAGVARLDAADGGAIRVALDHVDQGVPGATGTPLIDWTVSDE